MVAAYLNWGRWVADCPNCPNAELLTEGQTTFVCGHGKALPDTCGHTEPIEWPDDPSAITAGMAGENRKNQDWRP